MSVLARFQFQSGELQDESFQVQRFTGQEGVSTLYRFEIELVSDNPALMLTQSLHQPVSLTLEKSNQTRSIHGIVAELTLCRELPQRRYLYRAVLMPKLWLLTLQRQNQLFQGLNTPDLITTILATAGQRTSSPAANDNPFDDYCEIKLRHASYPTREYTVQHGESDFDFLSRLMEHEGLFYYFAQGESGEKLIIGDDNDDFPFYQDNNVGKSQSKHAALINYQHAGDQRESQQATIWQLRNQQQACQTLNHPSFSQYTFCADSTNTCIKAGDRFTLKGHHVNAFNGEHLITQVNHHYVVNEDAINEDNGETRDEYRNTMSLQSATIAYQAPRMTPIPRLYGIMNATIAGGGEGKAAQRDDNGRYKVSMPLYSHSSAKDSIKEQVSRYLPLASLYQGDILDTQSPLLKGTEVLWTCIEGDLDRPIIVGTVPIPVNNDVVSFQHYPATSIAASGSSVNRSKQYALQQQRHYSSAAISISSQGDVEEGRAMLFTVTLPHLPPAGHRATLNFTVSGDGAASSTVPDLVIDANSPLSHTVSINTLTDIDTDGASVTLSLNTISYSSGYPASQHYLTSATGSGNVLDKEVNLENESGTIFYRVDVPYVTDKCSYLRIGTSPISIDNTASPPSCSPASDAECGVWNFHKNEFLNIKDAKFLWLLPTPGDINFAINWSECKWLEHTDGSRVALTGGDYNIFSKGSMSTTSLGTSITYTLNDNYEVVMSSKYNVTTQFDSNIGIGGAVNAFLGAQVDLATGTKFECSPQLKVTALGGGELSYTRKVETNAVKSIRFQVEDTHTTATAVAGGVAATLGALTGGIAADLLTESNDPAQKDKLTRAIRDVSTAVWGAGTAAVATLSIMSLIKKLKPKPQSTFEMFKDQIYFKCGDSAILLNANGTIILNGKKVIINGTDNVEINSKNAAFSASETSLSAKNFKLNAATKMNGNLNLQTGNLDVPSGSIKGAGGKIGEQVFLSGPTKPVISEAEIKLTQQFGTVQQLMKVSALRRRQMLMGEDA